MNFNKIKLVVYTFFLTYIYGFKLQKVFLPHEKKKLRLEYSKILFSKLNISIKIENKDKIPLSGPYLIFSNHRSILDPLIIDIALEESTIFGYWVSKKELYNSIVFGKAVQSGGCIRVDREDTKNHMFFSEIKDVLHRGNSISIFPEGTRNKTDTDLLEFKKGINIIAIKNKLPMLPIYIKTNSADIQESALMNNKKNREIIVVIGDPIHYSEKHIEENYRTMFNI